MDKEDKIPQKKMATGEIELRKIFEETTIQNVKMVVGFSQETRKLVRDVHQEVKKLGNLIISKEKDIKNLNAQVASLQQRLYAQGT